MNNLSILSLLLMVFLSGCAKTELEIAEEPSEQIEIETLEFVYEVGELMGDSNYVFGVIASALPTAGGGIAVLDLYGCDISFFDSTGTFIRSIGGKGEGPGEFILPLDFVILEDGRIAVIDLVGRCIDILAENGELLSSIDTGKSMLPFKMEAIADSSFIIYYYSTQLTEESFDMGFNLEIWNSSGFQEEVWSWRNEYTGSDFLFAPGYISCCTGNENIFFSEMNNSEFSIENINLAEGTSVVINRESVTIEADSSDIGYSEPKVFVNYTEIDLESEHLSYRPQVSSLGIDSENLLWIKNGTSNDEEWFLYNLNGDFVSNGRISGIPEQGRLKYVINEHGTLAWAPFTEEHPRVFVLSRK